MDQICPPRRARLDDEYTECTFLGWKIVDGVMKAVIEDYAGRIRYVEPHVIIFGG